MHSTLSRALHEYYYFLLCREKVKIPKNKPFITFLGAGMNQTKITWNDTARSSNGTFRSATVSVMANGFMARNLAFEV